MTPITLMLKLLPLFYDNNIGTIMTLDQIIQNNADNVFSSTAVSSTQFDTLANYALSAGATAYTNGKYEVAITNFKRAIALSPYGDNTIKAYKLLVQTYQYLGKTDESMKAWKQAANSFPQSDAPHLGMGNIYFSQKHYSAAESEYSTAVRLDSSNSDNVFALGQVYMAEGRYTEAETQFKKTVQLSPSDSSAYYGLGQLYHKTGDYEDALTNLKKAIALDKNNPDLYMELGKTYMDMNDTTNANNQLSVLLNLSTNDYNELQSYITQKTHPSIEAVYPTNGFNTLRGPNSSVSSLSSSLTAPNSSKTFSMNFTFSKDMDASSVLNTANWTITRSTAADPGGAYNWGLSVKNTEAHLPSIPESVTYNPDTLTATVRFRISQNSAGNATIDTSHILFKFSGVDAYKNTLNSSADEYSGMSQIA
jgi:tetratricopeptide (TPR) repeat protein